MIDLSIIIINYNTMKLTTGCLYSIFQNTIGLNYEVIVIDNASNDGSINKFQRIAKKVKSLKLILNRNNVGFGKANNQGIKYAKGRYLLLLNSDTIIKDNILAEMVVFMDKEPKIGVSTCALIDKSGSLQGTGGFMPTLFKVFAWMFFLDDIPLLDRLIKPFHPMHSKSPLYKAQSYYKKERQLDWVTGAFMLIRQKSMVKVGAFDEDYFMYTEEADLCYRIKKAGWQIWYLPKWNITHLGGASSNSEFPIISEYSGVKLFYKKHMPAWQYPLLRLLLKTGAILRLVLFGIIRGKGEAIIYAKAYQNS